MTGQPSAHASPTEGGPARGVLSAALMVAGAFAGAAVLTTGSAAGPAVGVASVAASLVIPLIAAWSVLSRRPRIVSPADHVTLLRVALIGVLTAALVLAAADALPARTWTVLILASLAAVLDAVDGWVARRTGTTSASGSRLDEESDAAALLVLSALLAMTVGWWVLLIGLMRYLFIAGSRIRRIWRRPLPHSGIRRYVAAAQAATVVVGLGPVVPVPLAAALAAAALAALLVSFGRDIWWLEGAGDSDRAEQRGGGESVQSTGIPWRTMAVGAGQVLITGVILWIIAALWGPENFTAALHGLPWWSFAAAGVLGSAGVVTQALRWRIVARHHAIEVRLGAAVARCWQAAFLNSVLPGGLAGDALRAADDSTDATVSTRRRALASGFASMAAERLVGTAVVFSAAGVVLLPGAPLVGAGCVVAAVVVAVIASRWLRRLPAAEILQVVALSVVGWICFAGLFIVSVAVLAPETPAAAMAGSAAVALAGMSLPVGVGGWGVREAAAAWSFTLSELSAADGVRVSVGYGLLALASTAPGAGILALRVVPRLRRGWRFTTGQARNS